MPVAFNAETIERYRQGLRLKVWYHLGSFCRDAEDLVQETMARFLTALNNDAIRKPESIGAFLNGICNRVIMEYRRRSQREELFGADAPTIAQPIAPELEWMEAKETIDSILPLLPDRERRVLRAFYLEERSKEELCHEFGITEAHFRLILFRAKDRFRKIYREHLKQRAAVRH
jgi:RNA polymerase sigma-70 factor, ECF subfamily